MISIVPDPNRAPQTWELWIICSSKLRDTQIGDARTQSVYITLYFLSIFFLLSKCSKTWVVDVILIDERKEFPLCVDPVPSISATTPFYYVFFPKKQWKDPITDLLVSHLFWPAVVFLFFIFNFTAWAWSLKADDLFSYITEMKSSAFSKKGGRGKIIIERLT